MRWEGTWYDVTRAVASQWENWNTSVRADSYSDCALPDTDTVEGREETETCYVGTAGTLVTHNCKLQLCPVCRFLQFPVDFQLRGVCLESPVDKFYVLHNSTELHGHSGSLLRWVEEESSWTITRKRETLASLRSESRSLPLGKHLWTFTSGCSDPGGALLL